MARSKLRAAAGAGSAAAFLLLGGAAVPVVSADPGYSHGAHGSRHGDDDGNSHRGGQGRDDDGGWQGNVSVGGSRHTAGSNRTIESGGPKPADGTSSVKPNQSGVATRTGTTTSRSEDVASPTVKVATSTVTARSVGGVTTPATLTPAPAVPSVPAGRVSGGGDSRPAAVAAPPVTAPRVTFGNGRSPGILSGRPEHAPGGNTSDVVAPPPEAPPAVTPQLPPAYRLDEAPAQRMVASLWAAAAPGWPSGLLFGIAGLILAPIAGAWLGYRQARASKAAAQLIRH